MTTVIYSGNLTEVPPIGGAVVIKSIDARPNVLDAALSDADQLVILDPVSFPYELLSDEHKDIPLAVVVPDWGDDDTLAELLREPVFNHFTPFDSVVVEGWERFEFYRAEFGFGTYQFRDAKIQGWFDDLVARPSQSASSADLVAAVGQDPRTHWVIPSRSSKAAFRLQAGLLQQAIGQRPGLISSSRDVRVLLAGSVTPRLIAALPRHVTLTPSIVDLEVSGIALRATSRPDLTGRRLGEQFRMPYPRDAFDFVLVAWLYSRVPADRWILATQELTRVAKPGSLVVILDRFVSRPVHSQTVSIRLLLDHIATSAGTRFVVTDLESITYPWDSGPSDAALSLSTLGSPTRL